MTFRRHATSAPARVALLLFPALACVLALGACQTTAPLNADTFTKDGVLSGATSTQERCAALSDGVWVVVDGQGDCIRYYAGGLKDRNDVAVVNFFGDFGNFNFVQRYMLDASSVPEASPEVLHGFAERVSKKVEVPIIVVARPGTLGSSGNHANRWTKRNPLLMNAALDAIAARHHIDTYALSGQSGGSFVVGALLPWRDDIRCAVMASSAASIMEVLMADRPGTPVDFARSYVYDPYDHIDEIKPNPDRTLYTLADKDDDITVYWAQKSFVDALRERGHDAVLIDQHGLGKFNHGLESQSFVTAALCAQKVPSRLIIEALEALARKQAAEAGK